MPSIKPYIPILRWKLGEILAMERLYPKDREGMTPLIEFIMPAPTTDKKDYKKILEDSQSKFLRILPGITQQIVKSWGKDPIFIDVHLLDGVIRTRAFQEILTSATSLDIFAVPVVHIIPVTSTDADMATREVAVKYAKTNGTGLCIRIDKSHLDDANIANHITKFVEDNKLDIKNTDLFVDLQVVDKNTVADSVIEKLVRLPELKQWRSFIVSGGAFPKDLSELPKHGHYELERLDWSLWKSIVGSKVLKRQPVFSDYTIQHPIYYGSIPGANTSASVRYTNDEIWDVMRGEGLRNEKGAGNKQYPAHAQLMVTSSFYKGANYSFGDSYITERAKPDNKKSGNPTTWITAGINHHLTLVTRQIASLPGN